MIKAYLHINGNHFDTLTCSEPLPTIKVPISPPFDCMLEMESAPPAHQKCPALVFYLISRIGRNSYHYEAVDVTC